MLIRCTHARVLVGNKLALYLDRVVAIWGSGLLGKTRLHIRGKSLHLAVLLINHFVKLVRQHLFVFPNLLFICGPVLIQGLKNDFRIQKSSQLIVN